MKHPLVEFFCKEKIVVILRGLHQDRAVEVAEILADCGVRLMEIPLNTPNALESIALLAGHFKNRGVHIGAGTVLTPEAAAAVHQAGGEYIISPNVNPAVIRRTRELGMLSMPGFQTPTEAFAAIEAGADILKAFPCGTPRDIQVLKSVIPLPIFAVGGIDAGNRDEFLQVAEGVGVGVGIFKPEMTAAELRRSAECFMVR